MSGERLIKGASEWTMLVVAVLLFIGGAVAFILGLANENLWLAAVGVVVELVGIVILPGLFVNPPNLSRVVILFGRYTGTVRENGFRWVNSFARRTPVSLRIRTFDSDVLKVNDAVGNPVEIAAVINGQVIDTARATFDVDDYERFVHVQAEAAIRHVANEYPYDLIEDEGPSLRANADDVTATSSPSCRIGSKRPGSRCVTAVCAAWLTPPRSRGRWCVVNRQAR
jgi:regulator of protease activity HflC (stomatin/prohibitin superfamily)